MYILNHFQNINLNSDQKEVVAKIGAFLNDDQDIFILKGYAGSGKTTLLKGIREYLKGQKIKSLLMAPTGRAAKILREKVGEANTIHKTIYNLFAIELKDDKEDAGKTIKYKFPLDESPVDSVLIIDEASMISSKRSQHEIFTFGTGVLLDDILTFSKLPRSRNKIIFVGDPAQLSPVDDTNSFALEEDYFENKGFKVETATLCTVMRQENNAILENATRLRSLLDTSERTKLELNYDQKSFHKIANTEIPHTFVNKHPVPEIGDGIVISFSNEQCLNYNRAIREKLYPGQKGIIPGDLLLICNNNYHSYKTELMNGDMAKVVAVEEELISRRNIPVYDTVDGERVKKHVNLDFRKIVIRLENFSEEIPCFIIETLLNSPKRELSILEMKALYIDFVIRFNQEQERKKQLGKPFYTEKSEEFKMQLKNDPYYNSLKVKYGYAITCHKAQGGEWDEIFVDYYGRNSLKKDPLRWSYTATTRARKVCYAANAPQISDFSHFKINSITEISNVPDDYYDLSQIALSPFHKEEDHRAKSLKYWEISSKLEDTPFEIVSIFIRPHLERYTIKFQEKTITIEAYHNGAGIFDDFSAVNTTSQGHELKLLELINTPFHPSFNINYSPRFDSLSKLYSLMQAACDACDVSLTNVVEKPSSYMVTYFLKTNAKAAMIQFYYNKNEQVTRAMPKSTAGVNDEKLNRHLKEIERLTFHPIEANL